MLEAVLAVWIAWAGLNTLAMLCAPWIIRHPGSAYTNGFRVVVPWYWKDRLSEPELAAIVAHEHGHLAHWHPWKNLLRVCLFVPRNAQVRREQEFEADDFAAKHADRIALASALRRLSADEFDRQRADRLEAMQV